MTLPSGTYLCKIAACGATSNRRPYAWVTTWEVASGPHAGQKIIQPLRWDRRCLAESRAVLLALGLGHTNALLQPSDLVGRCARVELVADGDYVAVAGWGVQPAPKIL